MASATPLPLKSCTSCSMRVPSSPTKRDGELALAGHAEVGGAVDVAIGVAADDDRLGPARHEPRHVAADDRLAEDDAAQNVADGAVRRLPHLLEVELLHPRLVGCDGRAFDADAAGLDGISGIDGDLVVGGVAVLDAEVEGEQRQVEIRLDQLLLDHLPDDPRHLVPVEVGDRVLHLDLVHAQISGAGKSIWGGRGPQAAPPPLRGAAPYSIVLP